jgi:hypothetical protein
MPNFIAPTYTKTTSANGKVEACYTFIVEFAKDDSLLTFSATSSDDISLATLQQTVLDNVEWWNKWLATFLSANAKHFSKQYSITDINTITKHRLIKKNPMTDDLFPACVTICPRKIQIVGGAFWVNWEYTTELLVIDIPVWSEQKDDEQNLPDERCIEELNIDAVSSNICTTEQDAVLLDNPTKFSDRQRVKELHLKATIATYKAQYYMKAFFDKYGENVIVSETDVDTDSDADENDTM